jgi:nitroimidazol reductase NimA-like FMN-containing flavoprotein (pyridoxamine 5'-phosphate oxidase superfamily)
MTDARQIYTSHPTADEIAEVLAQRVTATVGTLNEDGSVHLAYVIFLHEDDRLFFETSSVTRKARNVVSRPQATLLVQGSASTGRNLMVAAEGIARVLEGSKANAINHRLRRKYVKDDALDAIDRAWGPVDDIAIEITPVRWRTFTDDLLHEATVKELGGPLDSAWRPG